MSHRISLQSGSLRHSVRLASACSPSRCWRCSPRPLGGWVSGEAQANLSRPLWRGLAALTAGALALHNGQQQRLSGEQDAAALEKAFNIKTIRQLGSNKFFAVAAALVTLEEAG